MDEETRLGIDATEAFAALRKLQQEFSKYSRSLDAMAGSTQRFNAIATDSDDLLGQFAKAAGIAAKAVLSLAKAKRDATKASIDLQNQEKKEAEARRAAAQLDRQRVASASTRNLLGNITPGSRQTATLPELVGFDKAVDSFKNVVASSRFTEKQIKKILGNLGASYTGAARKIRDAAVQVVQANARLGQTNLAATARVLRQIGIEADKANPKIRGFQLNLSSIANFTIASLLSRSIQELGRAFADGARDASTFEFRLAEILTIANGSFGGLDNVADVVTRLSNEFGQPGPDVAAGLYEVLSNNIKDASDATLVLTESLQFSRAALATTRDSVLVVTGVLNSYGFAATSATRITDILFKTIDVGRVTGEELANTIGRILPLAATLGVRFEEVAASLATLTIQGVNAADAETQLTNIFLKLIRPTEALKRRYEEMGIATAEAGIAAFGFQGFLIELTKTSGTTASEIGELFNQIRGTRGVLGQVATGASIYAKNLEEIEKASDGAADAASKLIRETNAGVLQAELEKVRNFLVNDFGRSVLSVLATLVKFGIDGKAAIIGLTVAFAGAATVGAVITYGAITQAIVALGIQAKVAAIGVGILNGALIPAAIITLPVVVAAATVAYLAFRDANDEATAALQRFEAATSRAAEAEVAALRPGVEARKNSAREQVAAVSRQLVELNQLYNRDRANALAAQVATTDSLKRQLSERRSLLSSFSDGIADLQRQAENNVRSLNKEFSQFEFGIRQGQFDRAIEGLDPRRQGAAIRQRIDSILSQARQAAREGNAEIAKELFSEAASLGTRLTGIAGQRAVGEQQINRILSERRSLNDLLVKQERDKATEAAKIEEKQRQIVEQVVRQIDEFDAVQAAIEKSLKAGEDFNSIDVATNFERLRKLSQDIPANLSKVSLGNLKGVTDLQNLLRQIQQPFTSPTSTRQVPLSFAVDESIQNVLTKLTESTRRAPPELFVKVRTVTGQELDIFDPGQAQANVAQVGQAVQRGLENSLASVNANAAFETANAKIAQAARALVENASNSFRDAGTTAFGVLESADRAAQGFSNQVAKLVTLGLRGINEGVQTDAVPALQGILRDLEAAESSAADLASGNAAAKAAQSVRTLIEGFRELAAAKVQEAQVSEQSAATQTLEAALNGQKVKLGEVKSAIELLKPAADTTMQSVQNSVNSFNTTSAQSQVDALIRKINSIPPVQVPTSTPTGSNALGGFPRFGLGGIGVDNKLAWVNRREFIVNAESSRRFRPELVAMNAGRRPQSFATGGSVSNNFGDININVNGQRSQDVNARVLARKIKREVRRRTIS